MKLWCFDILSTCHLINFLFHLFLLFEKLANSITCQVILCTWYYHLINMSLDHFVILSTCHIINLSFHQIVISSNCHFIILSFHHLVISSTCHFINLSFHQLVISSTCHFINIPFSKFALCQLVMQPVYNFDNYLKRHPDLPGLNLPSTGNPYKRERSCLRAQYS